MDNQPIQEGKLIAGRWRVVAELEGPGATRYRVRDTGGWDGEMIILPDLGDLPERVEAVRELTHENVIRPVETGSWASFHYVVRELVAGQTLRDWLWREERLAYDQALGVACQLCLASRELAECGVEFLGYHPEAVLVDPDGFVKVDPLRLFDRCDDPVYRSPEELRGGTPDQRSDVFRIGALIYLMISGEAPPGSGKGFVRPEPLHTRFAGAPLELDAALERILSPDPRERPAGPEELLDILHPLLMEQKKLNFSNDPGAAAQRPAWHETSRFWLYVALGLAGLVGVLIVLGSLFSFFT